MGTLNYWAFDVIFSSNQLSHELKVSNGGPINRNISVNRCRFEIKAWNFDHLGFSWHEKLIFGHRCTLR